MKNLLTSFILCLFAVPVFVILFIVSQLLAIYNAIRYKSLVRRLSYHFLNTALSIDIAANSMYSDFLNVVFIKRNSYSFGVRGETISSALGKNQCINGLTWLGVGFAGILDTIDESHCWESIDDKVYWDVYKKPEKVKTKQIVITFIVALIIIYLSFLLTRLFI